MPHPSDPSAPPFPWTKTKFPASYTDSAKSRANRPIMAHTCIMPNSSPDLCVSLFSSPSIPVIQNNRGEQTHPPLSPHWVGTGALVVTGDPSLGQDQGEDLGRGGERRGPVWPSPNGASCGYRSNLDYYVVPPLTLMGCYNDLK